jgi:hypothetical protein
VTDASVCTFLRHSHTDLLTLITQSLFFFPSAPYAQQHISSLQLPSGFTTWEPVFEQANASVVGNRSPMTTAYVTLACTVRCTCRACMLPSLRGSSSWVDARLQWHGWSSADAGDGLRVTVRSRIVPLSESLSDEEGIEIPNRRFGFLEASISCTSW